MRGDKKKVNNKIKRWSHLVDLKSTMSRGDFPQENQKKSTSTTDLCLQ